MLLPVIHPLTNHSASAIRVVCPILIDLGGPDRGASCAKPSNLFHYIIVRKDIPIGAQLAQACHAAGESPGPKPEPGCTVVVLHAENEKHLNHICWQLTGAGLDYGEVVECPDDEEWPDQLMAIGLAPTTDRAAVKRVLSSLPLARF